MTIHTKVDILDFGFNFVKIARQMCFLTCKNNETMLHRQHSANYNDYKMNRLTLAVCKTNTPFFDPRVFYLSVMLLLRIIRKSRFPNRPS